MKKRKIGDIKLKVYSQNNLYKDNSEKYLFDLFKYPQDEIEEQIVSILNTRPSWPILYHLSYQRRFILEWYEFKYNSALLEIGAGCGALTGLFSEKVQKVYANELSTQRAEIIARRYSNRNNISVLAENIASIKLRNSFDYITLIGVLEYAGRFFSVNKESWYISPFEDLLKISKHNLNENGHLLIAIENKLGYKYLIGGKEDHYGDYFSSIEDYPNYKGIRTFTKSEIKKILLSIGFKNIKFYYPFPDYKMPLNIFSEQMLSDPKVSSSFFSYLNDPSNTYEPLFSENIFIDNLRKEKVLDKFANSFLIDAY